MAAYVPGFDRDVFISYAHVDDFRLGKDKAELGWVHQLVEDLKVLLRRRLGVSEWDSVWIDYRELAGNLPLTPEIRQFARSSATLVVILSKSGYLRSEWCQQERELFLAAAQSSGGAWGRLFVVQLDDIDRSNWPAPFADLPGYEFFLKDQSGTPRTLGFDADDPNGLLYAQRLDDLSRALAKQLEDMCTGHPVPIATIIPATAAPAASATAAPIASTTTPLDASISVFLAETTSDLEDLRDDIKRQLEQAGLRVLPATYYPRSPDDFAAAMQVDLKECRLFVQLLGPYTTRKTADLPKGYEGLQLYLARETDKPIMRWRDPALQSDSSKNPELQSDDIMVMAFGDFKRNVETRARSLAAKQKLDSQREKSGYIPGDAFALVNAKQIDQEVADDVCQVLTEHNIGYDRIFDEETPLTELAKEAGAIDMYNALVFVYGQCEPSWVRTQLRTCYTIMKRKQGREPVCALYIGPPDKEYPSTMPPKVHYFKDYHEEAFNRFISDVQTKVERCQQ